MRPVVNIEGLNGSIRITREGDSSVDIKLFTIEDNSLGLDLEGAREVIDELLKHLLYWEKNSKTEEWLRQWHKSFEMDDRY